MISILVFWFTLNSLSAEPLPRSHIELDLDSVEGSIRYELSLKKKGAIAEAEIIELRDPKWEADLEPGIYSIRIRSIDSRGVAGQWGEPTEIVVNLPAVLKVSPTDGEKITGDPKLSWQVSPGIDRYQVVVINAAGKTLEDSSVKSAEMSLHLPPDSYSWTVKGYGPGDISTEESKPSTFFVVAPPPKPSTAPRKSRFFEKASLEAGYGSVSNQSGLIPSRPMSFGSIDGTFGYHFSKTFGAGLTASGFLARQLAAPSDFQNQNESGLGLTLGPSFSFWYRKWFSMLTVELLGWYWLDERTIENSSSYYSQPLGLSLQIGRTLTNRLAANLDLRALAFRKWFLSGFDPSDISQNKFQIFSANFGISYVLP